MEPRQFEKSVEPRGEGQGSPPRQPERKSRFQIVKLEERIAPTPGHYIHTYGCGHTHGPGCYKH
jgi:hypothetical protein